MKAGSTKNSREEVRPLSADALLQGAPLLVLGAVLLILGEWERIDVYNGSYKSFWALLVVLGATLAVGGIGAVYAATLPDEPEEPSKLVPWEKEKKGALGKDEKTTPGSKGKESHPAETPSGTGAEPAAEWDEDEPVSDRPSRAHPTPPMANPDEEEDGAPADEPYDEAEAHEAPVPGRKAPSPTKKVEAPAPARKVALSEDAPEGQED
jgi:hypothetical protein